MIDKSIKFGEIKEIANKIEKLKSDNLIIKAQIHAGGRGKAGGVKLVKNIDELESEAKKMMGKKFAKKVSKPIQKLLHYNSVPPINELERTNTVTKL